MSVVKDTVAFEHAGELLLPAAYSSLENKVYVS